MAGLKLVAELGGDGTGFQTMMSRAQMTAKQFGATALLPLKNMIAGAFTVGAITSFINKTLEAADRIKDTADQLQITTDEVQQLDVAADRAGKSMANVSAALAKLGVARRSAAESDDDLVKVFARFGVSMADLQNPALRNLDILKKMAETSKTLELSNRDLTDLGDIFGQKMQSIFAVMEEMNKLGPIRLIDADTIDELKRAQVILKDMSRDAENIGSKLLAQEITGGKVGWEMFKRMIGVTSPEELISNIEKAVAGTTVADAFAKTLTGLVTEALGAGRSPKPAEDLFENKRKKEKEAEDKLTLPKSRAGVGLVTDALVGVGNFLGRNPALIQDIAVQQLNIARMQLARLDSLVSLAQRSGQSLEVPAL